MFISDSESESGSSSSPNVKNSQLGALQNICLDNVYMNYLKKKAEEKPKTKKRSKYHKRSQGRRQGPIKDNSSSDSSCSSSPTHSKNKERSAKKREKKNKNQTKDDHLLINLIQKNVKEGEFTPEQKTLYEAHDVLMEEYKRRKDQRHKVGGLFKKNTRNLRSILQNAMAKGRHMESDLQLKARSKDLQNRRKEKKKRNFTSFAAIVDADKI